MVSTLFPFIITETKKYKIGGQKMAKITRIKPKKEGMLRIELEFTHAQFIKIFYFKPEALKVRDEESKVTTFELGFGDRVALGTYGVQIPIEHDCQDKVIRLFDASGMVEEQLLATAVNAQNNLTKIEKQVTEALVELGKADESIEEV